MRFILLFLLATTTLTVAQTTADRQQLLARDNLVAWCVVPFDASKRGPAERAAMLAELGLKKCAYDWRAEHVPTFEQEILEYRKHGIEFFAFWSSHEEAFKLFEKYDLNPQIWQIAGSPSEGTQAEKIEASARSMEPLAKRTAKLGCKLGLYNHGGWSGEPENMVAICKRLRELGYANVGLVYNWHHGHEHIDDWAESLELMKPYLLCLNLNGMNTGAQPKILPLAQGQHELEMLEVVLQSGYDGPIGILDHQTHLDTKENLQDNLDGLDWLTKELVQPGAAGPKPTPTAKGSIPPPPPPAKPTAANSLEGFGKALTGGLVVDGKPDWREPPVTVECRAKLDNAKGYNILVASDTKASNAHWEIFSMNGSGELTAYLPGATPDHVKSRKVITDGQWHAIAMQYGADRVRLWVDGQVVADQAIALKPNRKVVPGGLAFARLVEGQFKMNGAIDEVRLRTGIHEDLANIPGKPFGRAGKDVIGYWDFEKLQEIAPATAGVSFDPKPLDPASNPYAEEFVNRDRFYDFYAKQALHFGKLPPDQVPDVLPQFPGLDGGSYGHWGNQNDEDTWKDGRVAQMDHGSMVSGVFRGVGKTIPRGVSVRLGDGLNAVYNKDTTRFEVIWKGDLVKWSDVRRGFMQGTPMGGEPVEDFQPTETKSDARYLGLYRFGDEVIFASENDGQTEIRMARERNGGLSEVTTKENLKTRGGPARWPQRIETRGELGEAQPYAIDTLTLPYENPWNALFFVSGVDFLSESRIAICTIHGDVWICDVLADDLSKLSWKRYAAGLHQPLGLKVVDGVIHVMCRDQITALHDFNDDDEADFYECVSNSHQTSAGGHDFITGLERDDQGRWYFASGNQGVCRVSGQELEVIATGFRNPNGLGVSPDGAVILAAVQEGDWTPASAICDVVKGGHYGAGGPKDGPLGYLPPMLYLPRGVDNSCGGQTFIDSDRWGPVAGKWLHYSSGAATHFLVLREVIEGQSQAAAIPLHGEFLSGAHRGRFSQHDGQLYVASAQGWGNYGVEDGALQRVRFTGGEFPYPTSHETRENGIFLEFADPVGSEAKDTKRWFAQQWNYLYGPSYGSPEYSARHPQTPGHDRLEIRSVQVLDGGKRVFVEIPQLQPVNQLHLHFDGPRRIELLATIHRLGEPFVEFPGYQKIEKEAPQQLLAADFEGKPNPWATGEPGRSVRIQAVIGLQFDQKRLTAKTGERLSLTFDNPDSVPHNWVLGKPGSLKTLGELANRLMTDPAAVQNHYVPKSADVLAHSSLMFPGKSHTIHFNAPETPGEYPFLCTFPGHWMVMNGVLEVE